MINKFKNKIANVISRCARIFFDQQNENGREKYFLEKIVQENKTSNLAIVIHLFYFDNWPLFKKKLTAVKAVSSFDLFITIPEQNKRFISEIQSDFPKTNFFVVPNRGRDVLPFLKVGHIVATSGYEYLLKFHSKKSTHREDGQDWLEETLNQIIGKEDNIAKIIELLKDKQTGVIGPKEFYYPLLVNLNANGVQLNTILEKVMRQKMNIGAQADEYGFFGGTMFWSRVDAIAPLFLFSKHDFQQEAGQIDGTFAHAMERAFCIMPELTNRNMYASSFNELVPQPYMSENIPEWFKEG